MHLFHKKWVPQHPFPYQYYSFRHFSKSPKCSIIFNDIVLKLPTVPSISFHCFIFTLMTFGGVLSFQMFNIWKCFKFLPHRWSQLFSLEPQPQFFNSILMKFTCLTLWSFNITFEHYLQAKFVISNNSNSCLKNKSRNFSFQNYRFYVIKCI